ncbi:MAG: sensor histidine kinase [Acidobacteriota bacterium]
MSSCLRQPKQTSLSPAELEETIVERTEEVQSLSRRLLKVQDGERRRIARNLHDSTGQTLTALKISASLLQEECKQCPSALRSVSEVVALADQAINEIRTISYLLHPPLLEEAGLRCAAEWYVEGFSKRSGIDVTFDFATQGERLPLEVETALFRILQKSLTNVHRHSKAKRASVRYMRHSDKAILEIQDFGCGIAAERLVGLSEVNAETGVGLPGMRERLNELNSWLELESDGHGTTIRAVVPIPQPMRPSSGLWSHFSGRFRRLTSGSERNRKIEGKQIDLG